MIKSPRAILGIILLLMVIALGVFSLLDIISNPERQGVLELDYIQREVKEIEDGEKQFE